MKAVAIMTPVPKCFKEKKAQNGNLNSLARFAMIGNRVPKISYVLRLFQNTQGRHDEDCDERGDAHFQLKFRRGIDDFVIFWSADVSKEMGNMRNAHFGRWVLNEVLSVVVQPYSLTSWNNCELPQWYSVESKIHLSDGNENRSSDGVDIR